MTFRECASAFDLAYRRHYKAVSRFVEIRVANTHDAQDIVAATFATAWRDRNTMPQESATPGWLLDIARRHVSNYWRAKRRWRALVAAVYVAEGSSARARMGTATWDIVNSGDEGSVVAKAVLYLRKEDQEVLRMIYWQGRGHAEVADLLGCSRNALDLRLSRARATLGTLVRAIETKGLPMLVDKRFGASHGDQA